jgi:hypothetical protein
MPADELPEPPEWLARLLERTGRRAESPARPAGGETILNGQRNTRLTSMGGALRRQGASEAVILAALVEANETQCDLPLDRAEVERIARSVSRYEPRPGPVPTALVSSPPPADGTPDAPAEESAPESWRVIVDQLRDKYRPSHRVGDSVYSTAEHREVRRQEACAALPPDLIGPLSAASDSPQFKGGGVNVQALPGHFRKWAGTAWAALLTELPDEDAADLGVLGDARETFRRLVRDALLSEVVLGSTIGNDDQTRTERRSLIDWCWRFAKPGPWRSIRSKKCWCKLVDLGGGEVKLRVAVQHGLFAQLRADRRLTEMPANTLGRRADRYGVGRTDRNDRPHGQRAVILDQAFVDDLLSGIPDDPAGAENGGQE